MGIWKDKFGYVAEENELLRAEIARLNANFANQHRSTWKNVYMNLSKATWEIKMEAEKLKADNAETISTLESVQQERDVLRATNHLLLNSYDDMRCRLGAKDAVITRIRNLLAVKTKELHFLREQYQQRTQDNEEVTDGTD